MALEFPMEYFLDEVRDGFFVPGMMKRAWAISVKDYKALEQTCIGLGIDVSATWGTLIGAVRHGGVIPWDDDIDVEIIRRDYMKLKESADRGELPEGYNIRDYKMDQNENLVRKWLDSESLLKKQEEWKDSYGFPFASNIDMMLTDYMPGDKTRQKEYLSVAQTAAYLKGIAVELEQDGEIEDRSKKEKELKKGMSVMEQALGIKFDPKKDEKISVQILEALDKYLLRFDEKNSDRITEVSYRLIYDDMDVPASTYKETVAITYENTTIQVPIGYDGLLRKLWGNYMIPYVEFGGHSYPFYKEFEKKLKEMHDIELLHYHIYPAKELPRLSEREKRIPVKDEFAEIRDILIEAHEYVRSACESGSYDDELFGVLEQCQNLAIQIGGRIENRISDSREYVSVFEQYCDIIYGIFQCVSNGEAVDLSGLDEVEKRMKEIDLSGEHEKREVVFLVYRSEHWPSLHSLWKEAVSDPNTHVTVIVVPYYYKGFDGVVIKDAIIDTEGIPEEVVLTSYDEYSWEDGMPDIVFLQCPYDEYHSAMTVNPYFYTSNIRKYAKEMVLIPPFILREVSEKDERSRFTLRSFVETPGFLYADRIIAQSENMRDVFIELTKAFSERELGEDTSDMSPYIDWEKKITGEGTPINDWLAAQEATPAELPDDWKNKVINSDGSRKKIILFQITGSMLYDYGVDEVEKKKIALSYLESRSEDIVVVWSPDPYAKDILEKHSPETWEAYKKWKDEYRERGSGIYDESSDYEKMAEISDAFYGDGCLLMNDCRMKGKPILWETPGADIDSNGEEKNWSSDIIIATEGDWTLSSFIGAVLRYTPQKREAGNAKRIWESMDGSKI